MWGVTLFAVAFAVAGHFVWWVVVPLGLVLAIAAYRSIDVRTDITAGFWMAAVAIAVASAVVGGLFPAEHLLTGRDAGTYVATAVWLSDHHELPVDAQVGAFAGSDDLIYEVPGFYEADGRLGPQFLHAFPALMALVDQSGGLREALRLNAWLGAIALLIVFAFASLLMRPFLALLVEGSLAVNLVFIYYTRAPFSEVLTIIFIFGGLWVLWNSGGSPSRGLMGGLVLGGAVLTRIDSLVLFIPLVAIGALGRWKDKSVGAAVAGLAVMAVIAAADVILVDPYYLGLLHTQVLSVLLAVVLAVVIGAVLGSRASTLWAKLESHRGVTRAAVAGVLGLLAVFVYFVRPYLGEAMGSPYGLDVIQAARGLPIEPTRTYYEWSAHWLAWYVGPILLVAVAGWMLMSARVVAGHGRRAIPFLAVFSTFTVLYVWRPSINPDHLWAMRRFLPVVIPGLLVCAGWGLDRLFDTRRLPSWGTRSLVAVLAAVMIVGPLRTTLPLASAHEFDGLAEDFQHACGTLGTDAAVVVLDTPETTLGPRLVQGFRSYCNIPAAYSETPIGSERLEALSAAWAANGRVLWVVDGTRNGEDQALFDRVYQRVELTLTRAPDKMDDFPLHVWARKAA